MTRLSSGFTREAISLALKRYWPSTVLSFNFVVANRTQHLLQVLGEVLPVIVMYFVWKAAYLYAPTFGGLSQAEMVTYLFVAQFFRIIAGHNQNEWQIGYWIRTGDLVRQLILPLRFMWNDFFRGLGWLIAVGALSGGLLMVAGVLFFGVALPAAGAMPALALSLLLAIAISYGISYLIGGLAFWTEGSTWGLSAAKGVILSFASGALIPLSLFPDWLRTVVDFLPFQAGVHTPTAIYLGHLQGAALWRALGVQALWAAALLFVADRFFHYSLRKVTIPGG